jgi:hypothetical protein
MNETHPPRVAEAILESFGADAELRDAILGDLAQEHALRFERYGQRAARLWYFRQAVLAAPALLRNWVSGARWSDVRRLMNVVGLAYVITMMIEIGGLLAIGAVVVEARSFLEGGLLGRSGFLAAMLSSTKIQTLVALIAGTFGPTCAGYFAASFEEKRPMIGAAAFAAASAIFIVAGIVLTSILPLPAIRIDTGMFIAMRLAAIPVIAILCLAGGALRVRTVSARLAGAASSIPS